MLLVHPNSEQQVLIHQVTNENPETRDRDLEHIKNWLLKQPHLPDTWDEQALLSFLRGCKFCLDTCKKKLNAYFTYRTNFPEFFTHRDIRRKELQSLCEIFDAAVLPDLTPHGRRVSVAKAAKYDFETPNLADLVKIVFMAGDLRLKLETVGVCDIYIADLNFPISSHFYKINPMILKKMFMCIQDAYPVIIEEIHLVNAPFFVEFVLGVIKPFMSKSLRDAIHVHSNIETLYDFVPKEILPEEFGGSAGKVGEIKKRWMETMDEYCDWFEKEESIKADLTKKVNVENTVHNPFGFFGSLQKNWID